MITLFSPAKINLFLRVVSKRPEGYHHLSSVFQTISLGDTLTFQQSHQDEFTCSDRSLPSDRSNLIWKAVDLFRRHTGHTQCLKIHVEKRIPVEGGLGGGSSNAATALWACNQLTNSKIPLETLKYWGREIGSDVPFFFSQGTAYCTGRGESVYHLPALPPKQLSIVKPPRGLSTPAVFQKLNFGTSISEKIVQRDLEDFLSGRLSYFNDLEKPAFELYPEIGHLKTQLLDSGFETALLSGSGSSLFCLGNGQLPPDSGAALLPASYLNRSLSEWYNR